MNSMKRQKQKYMDKINLGWRDSMRGWRQKGNKHVWTSVVHTTACEMLSMLVPIYRWCIQSSVFGWPAHWYTAVSPGGSRIQGCRRPMIPNLTGSTASSWGSLQNPRVSAPHLLAESKPPGAPGVGVGLRDIDFCKSPSGFLQAPWLEALNFERGSRGFQILTCCLGKEILL